MRARSDRGCACASAPSAKKPSTPAVPRSMRTGSSPVLPDRLQAQAAFAGREAHAVGDLRMARCAAGADGDAAACRAARRTHRRRRGSGVARSRRGARRQARRSLAVAGAALAEREARVDAGRQHLVDIEHVPVADGESPEGRQRRLLAIGLLFLLLAKLPRGAAVGAALEVGVERRCLQAGDVQGRAMPGTPEVAVAELQVRVAGEQRVRRRAPRRRADLDRGGADADAAEQADANARGALPVAAEDDAAIEHRFEPVLDRTDQERPADRFAEEDRADERGDERDQRQRPTDTGAPGGERSSHAGDSRHRIDADLSVPAGAACGLAPTVGAQAPPG